MRSPECVFLSPLEQSLRNAFGFLWFWWKLWVCFQFRVIQGTCRFLSKNRQLRVQRAERGGRGSKRRRKEEEEEGTSVMSTRCLTFAGSHILWSFGWCMIGAWTYVRGDTWAPFTWRGGGKRNIFFNKIIFWKLLQLLQKTKQKTKPLISHLSEKEPFA